MGIKEPGFLRMFRLIPLAALLLCATGCVSCPPDWFLEKPVEDGYRHAVGRCDPTYVESKARELAFQSALSELARQKSVWVLSLGEFRSTERGTSGSEESAHYSEVDIEGADIIAEHMCDGSWGHQYPKGTFFVLVRIEEKKLFSR
jgi:hypothetical protein